jgi:hypothetical protein
MGCNCRGSKKKITARKMPNNAPVDDIMAGYKYLKPHQIKARLEVYKRNNCKNCEQRYKCDYDMYRKCKGLTPKLA